MGICHPPAFCHFPDSHCYLAIPKCLVNLLFGAIPTGDSSSQQQSYLVSSSRPVSPTLPLSFHEDWGWGGGQPSYDDSWYSPTRPSSYMSFPSTFDPSSSAGPLELIIAKLNTLQSQISESQVAVPLPKGLPVTVKGSSQQQSEKQHMRSPSPPHKCRCT